ncbi:hypothetical protein C8R43DRAFT_1126241 [Mycena crocata]|nr:hypothetical protein C8R43DRAFT_1126241 [Mycena crocata]
MRSFTAFPLVAACLSAGVSATVGQASLLLTGNAFEMCGTVIHDSDLAVAVSSSVFASGARCGDHVTVQFGGRSVVLKVVDECPICIASSIEMTQAAYTALMAPVIRPVTVNWNFD